ncbi:MAG: VWA domain-containing protein [Candidatus Melainabacteria bacterium]|nr:VWA domain-containing protein [Candidatus Melainabacteria bacterium]
MTNSRLISKPPERFDFWFVNGRIGRLLHDDLDTSTHWNNRQEQQIGVYRLFFRDRVCHGLRVLGLFLVMWMLVGVKNLSVAAPLQAGTQTQAGPEFVMIVLDASSSMREKLPTGETKWAAAQRTILEVIQRVPPQVNVGLRVYGHKANYFTSCRATELLVAPGANTRGAIAAAVQRLEPTGATPISHSLLTSIAQDFPNLPGKKRIILVSDGGETCDADPCGVTVNMVRRGVEIQMDVVGFGLYDLDAVRQLKCISAATYGRFYRADTAAQLADGLSRSLQANKDVQGKIILKNAPSVSNTAQPRPNVPLPTTTPPRPVNRSSGLNVPVMKELSP